MSAKLLLEKLSQICSLHFYCLSKIMSPLPLCSPRTMMQKHQQLTDSSVNLVALHGAAGQLTVFSSYYWRAQYHTRQSCCGSPDRNHSDIYPCCAVSLQLYTPNPRFCCTKHTQHRRTLHKSMAHLTSDLFLLSSLQEVAPSCPAHEESFTAYSIFIKRSMNTSHLNTVSILLYKFQLHLYLSLLKE